MSDFEVFDKAYERFQQFFQENGNLAGNVFASQKELRDIIENTDMDSFDEELIHKFFLGKKADEFSSEGAATGIRPNYEIFMKDEKTREILKKYIGIRRKQYNGRGELFAALRDNLIFTHLERSSFGSKKPKFHVNRMMIILFPEICTTVANFNDLKNVAGLLGIDAGNNFNKSLFNIHYQVRSKTDNYLREKGVLDSLSEFEKAAFTWFLVER
jgi:hypothetical protein